MDPDHSTPKSGSRIRILENDPEPYGSGSGILSETLHNNLCIRISLHPFYLNFLLLLFLNKVPVKKQTDVAII
jgi:hypothetical protein